MALYPVIMCGGAGARLWPASRPSRPKQFLALVGERSLFQETVARCAPLASGAGRLVVVAGVAHAGWIDRQLADLGVEATVLLEPEPRDSAPAMAAAAAWIAARDPQGVAAFVASDHFIPDHDAFRRAVREAAEAATAAARIVTLGVRPRDPSSAYGYIEPAGRGLSAVDAFVEKPDAATAEAYIGAGYLWNSGNFIVSAATLVDQLNRHAPQVLAAAQAALPDGEATALTDAFRAAPKISIDYAVMEKTDAASVLEVDFEWSDLGAWDAIAATGAGSAGTQLVLDGENCLIRAPEGMVVAAVGVRDLAIIVEKDAVLVCDLNRAQDVKGVVEALKAVAPGRLDFDVEDAVPAGPAGTLQ